MGVIEGHNCEVSIGGCKLTCKPWSGIRDPIEFTVEYMSDGTGLVDRLRDKLDEFSKSPSLSARIEIINLAVDAFGCHEIVGDIRKSTLAVLDYHSLPESLR